MRSFRCCALALVFWAGGTAAAEARQCSFTITPTTFTVASMATSRTLSIITGTQCSWTAASGVSWIAVSAGASGKGIGSVTFTVQQNPTAASRTGTLTVAGQTVSVTQEAGSCSYTLTPTSFTVESIATSRTVSVGAGASCTWTSATNAPWIAITSGTNGSGTGAVAFDIAANSGAVRSGVVTVGGQPVTIVQAGSGPGPIPPSPANLHIVR